MGEAQSHRWPRRGRAPGTAAARVARPAAGAEEGPRRLRTKGQRVTHPRPRGTLHVLGDGWLVPARTGAGRAPRNGGGTREYIAGPGRRGSSGRAQSQTFGKSVKGGLPAGARLWRAATCHGPAGFIARLVWGQTHSSMPLYSNHSETEAKQRETVSFAAVMREASHPRARAPFPRPGGRAGLAHSHLPSGRTK